MRIILFTDIPVWVRPLAGKLEASGAEIVIATSIGDVPHEGLIVNRISTLLFRKQPGKGADFLSALEDWEQGGREVVSGSRVLPPRRPHRGSRPWRLPGWLPCPRVGRGQTGRHRGTGKLDIEGQANNQT